MALTDEQNLEMYKNITEMHGYMGEIKKRGCAKGMERADGIEDKLEQNNRDHIKVKAMMALVSVGGAIAIYWGKVFGK